MKRTLLPVLAALSLSPIMYGQEVYNTTMEILDERDDSWRLFLPLEDLKLMSPTISHRSDDMVWIAVNHPAMRDNRPFSEKTTPILIHSSPDWEIVCPDGDEFHYYEGGDGEFTFRIRFDYHGDENRSSTAEVGLLGGGYIPLHCGQITSMKCVKDNRNIPVSMFLDRNKVEYLLSVSSKDSEEDRTFVVTAKNLSVGFQLMDSKACKLVKILADPTIVGFRSQTAKATDMSGFSIALNVKKQRAVDYPFSVGFKLADDESACPFKFEFFQPLTVTADADEMLYTIAASAKPDAKLEYNKTYTCNLMVDVASLEFDPAATQEYKDAITAELSNIKIPLYISCQDRNYLVPLFEDPDMLAIDPAKVKMPDLEPSEGSIAALFDDDSLTFCHSAWSTAIERESTYGSYLEVELDEPVSQLSFAMMARSDIGNPCSPAEVVIYTSNDGTTWTKRATHKFEDRLNRYQKAYAGSASEPLVSGGETFRYFRWCVLSNDRGQATTGTTNGTTGYWNLSELRFFGK